MIAYLFDKQELFLSVYIDLKGLYIICYLPKSRDHGYICQLKNKVIKRSHFKINLKNGFESKVKIALG
jgi:hypothetical protein